jgi:hypothetical protein
MFNQVIIHAASAYRGEADFHLKKFIESERLSNILPQITKMRRAIRIDRSVDLLRSRAAANTASPYLCSSCSYQTSSFSTSSSRPADKKITLTEKVRRKIWGTDQPPGLEDPYGNASVLDRTNKRAQEQDMAPRSAVHIAELDPSYVPAATWDGLERVGGFGRWWKENWDPDHRFEGFLPRDTTTDQNAIVDALRRAIVEVFALRKAGMSLSEVSKSISTWDPTEHVQILPSTTGATLQFSQEVTLDMIIQSLSPAATDETDETAVKGNPSESEAEVAADRSSADPLHPEQSAEVDETAVKGNPSESEADVAADRSTVDPLHRDMPHDVDETAAKGNPSESEANVAADRSTVDPNTSNKSSEHSSKTSPISPKTYADAIEPRDAAWLEISLENPDVKFAVSAISLDSFPFS